MKLNGKRKLVLVALIAILSISVTYAAVVNYISNPIDQDVGISSPIELAGEVMYWPARQGVLGVKDGEAEFTIALKHGGSYSAHLIATGEGDEARILIPMPNGTTLGDIDSISWWVYTVAGYPPHVDIILGNDIDGDTENIDSLTAELACNVVDYDKVDLTYGEWVKTFEGFTAGGPSEVDNSTVLWVTRHGAGDEDAPWGTLAELKDGTVYSPGEGDPTITIDGDVEVLRLELEVDYWVFRDGESACEAYVDDISIDLSGAINDFDLEPETEDFNGATLPIYAGCYFDFVFDVENQANLPMDGRLQIVINANTTTFEEDPGDEFEDVTGYTFTLPGEDLILTANEDVTFDPVTPVKISLHLELVPDVEPDTYTFSAQIVPEIP